MNRLNLLLSAILLSCFTIASWAAPHFGDVQTFQQPDDSLIQLRVFGDEFYADLETPDGASVIRDAATGFFCYAGLSADGKRLESTGVPVGLSVPKNIVPKKSLRIAADERLDLVREAQELLRVDEKGRLYNPDEVVIDKKTGLAMPKSPPSSFTIGKRVGLVLLIRFPDRPGDVAMTQADVDAFCNQPGYTNFGNHGSIYDFFYKQSQGRLRYTAVVTAYYTTKHNRDYYTDESVSYGTRAREMIIEALDYLNAQGFDFSKVDGNGDGIIDGVNTFYSGYIVNGWAKGLWPHMSGVTWSDGKGYNTGAYQITDMGDELSIGTYSHENGHMLCGFPDLYDYGYESAGAGSYSWMASGSHGLWPKNSDIYLKRAAGWVDTEDFYSNSHFRAAVRVDSGSAFRYPNPANTKEYFLFYVRSTPGYESPPDKGLIIWHCDHDGSNNDEQMTEADHYEASVEQADGNFDLEKYNNGSDSTDLYHWGGVTNFNDNTLPDARWWAGATGTNGSGQLSDLHIHSVSMTGQVMTFVVGEGAVGGSPVIGLDESTISTITDYGSDAATEQFAIWNRGGGTLSYAITDDVSWASCSPASGSATTEGDLITLTFATAALSSGAYTATIVAVDGSASNSPQTIHVELTVLPRPAIIINTNRVEAWTYLNDQTAVFFDIHNPGGGYVEYSNSESVAWLDLSISNGSLQTEYDVVYAACDATGLGIGTYYGTVTVYAADATNSPQQTVVQFTLINEPEMELRGNENIISSGSTSVSADTFTDFGYAAYTTSVVSRTFSIVNVGSSNLFFPGTPKVTVSGPHSNDFTVTIQPTSPVAGKSTNTFEISFTPSATGTRTAAVSIANNDADENPYTFQVEGFHIPPATTPFFEGFESGVFSNYWIRYSDGNGRIRIISTDTPHSGANHAALDNGSWEPESLNELILAVNLAGLSNVTLRFWHKEFGDEDHVMASTFTGHNKSDGVAISSDGATWYRLVDLTGDAISNAYKEFVIDLDAAVQSNGIAFSEGFQIKFQQYDDYYMTSDGFTFDDISLTNAIPVPPTNAPPSVNAGINQILTLPTSNAALNATISDDGQPAGVTNISWSKQSGPGTVSFTPSFNLEDPTASFSTSGTYVLKLEVNDGVLTNSDTVTITVNPESDGADWSAYHDMIDVDDNATNTTRGSSGGTSYGLVHFSDGSNLPVSITFIYSGATPQLGSSTPTNKNPNTSTDAYELFNGTLHFGAGYYFFWSNAPDHSAELIISNANVNKRYEVALFMNRAGPYGSHTLFELRNAASFSNASSAGAGDAGDANESTVEYHCENTANGYVARWTGIAPSSSTFSVYMTRYSGDYAYLPQGVAIREWSVPPTNGAPSVEAGPGKTNLYYIPVALEATISDDGQPASVTNIQWSKQSGPGTVNFSPSANVEDPSVSFSANGIYILKLDVNDGSLTNSDTVRVVGNMYPSVSAGDDQSITLPVSNALMDAAVSDDGLPTGSTNIIWFKTAGPGSVSFSPSANVEDPTVTFSSTGVYTLALQVSDGPSADSDSVQITVLPGANWAAYHDMIDVDDNATNTTRGSGNGTWYELLDYHSGVNAGVQVQFSYPAGQLLEGGSGDADKNPNPGTDAYDIFNGIINVGLNYHYLWSNTPDHELTMTFSNVNVGQHYRLALFGNRDQAYNTHTHFTLRNAQAFSNASSAGVGDAGDADEATAETDFSYNTENGYVVQWVNMVPSGTTFSVVMKRLPGPAWYGYMPQAIMLQEWGAGAQSNAPVAGSGKTLAFDGTNDFVMIATNAAFQFGTNDFTVELWMKSSGWSGDPSILSDKDWNSGYNNGFILAGNSDQSTWKINIGDGANRIDLNGGTVADGQWHHLALVADRDGDAVIYQDGEEMTRTSLAAIGDINSGLPICLAQDGTKTYGHYYSGNVDEVRIWNTVRTVEQLQQNRFEAMTGEESGLIGYWRMDEGAGNVMADASNTGADGVMTNMAAGSWVDSTAWQQRDTVEDTSLISLAGYEPDGDAVTLSTLAAPANGAVTYDAGAMQWTYSPAQGWTGTDTFTYVMSDGVETDAFTVVVTVNEAPSNTLFVYSIETPTSPSTGLNTFAAGSTLTNWAPLLSEYDWQTQYYNVGWTMTGNNPLSGSNATFVMTLTNDAVLTWHFYTNVMYTNSGALNGGIGGDNPGWYPLGGSVTVTAAPASYYHFGGWTGMVPAGQTNSNPLVLTMNTYRAIGALFAENSTSNHSVPHLWFVQHGITGNFELAESSDQDGDGMTAWQEWIAGTDPTNIASLLNIRSGASQGGDNVIEWTVVSNRSYRILWGADINAVTSILATNQSTAGQTLIYTDSVHQAEDAIYYRIQVE